MECSLFLWDRNDAAKKALRIQVPFRTVNSYYLHCDVKPIILAVWKKGIIFLYYKPNTKLSHTQVGKARVWRGLLRVNIRQLELLPWGRTGRVIHMEKSS